MNDTERGRELSRLFKMRSKLKKAHPSIRARVEYRINELLDETARRFLEVFGGGHPIIRDLKQEHCLSRLKETVLALKEKK